MIRGPLAKIIRCSLLALYALASASIGFAHRQPQASAVDVAKFAMPDGTLPLICSTNSGKPGQTGVHKNACKACRLISAPGLPPSRADRDQALLRCGSQEQVSFSIAATLKPNPALPILGARGPPRV